MNFEELLAKLWHWVLLRILFFTITTLLGKSVAPLSDWVVKRAASRLPAKYANDCESQWLADFHTLAPWLRLKSAVGVLLMAGRMFRQPENSVAPKNAGMHSIPINLSELRRTLSFEKASWSRDSLTGLANRRALTRRICRLVALTRLARGSLSVILVNIDNLKSINDGYGHLAGDVLIKELGRRLRRPLRLRDCIGRFGGDEFAIVLPGTSQQNAMAFAEELRAECGIVVVAPEDKTFTVSASFGVASYISGTRTDEILSRADAALYQAKTDGGNLVREFIHTDK